MRLSSIITAIVLAVVIVGVGLLIYSKIPDTRTGGTFKTYALFHDGSRLQPGSRVITVEEGSLAGGFGSALMERVQQLGIENVRFHCIGIPDEYVHHGTQDVLRAQYDLHPDGIARRVREFLAGVERFPVAVGTK